MWAFLPQGVLVRLAEANAKLSDVQEQAHVKGMIRKRKYVFDTIDSFFFKTKKQTKF